MYITMSNEIKEVPVLSVPELILQIDPKSTKIYKDELLIIDFSKRKDKSFYYNETPARIGGFSMLIVNSGECSLYINYVPYRLKKNMLIVMRGNHIISKILMSDDFTGYNLIAKIDFLRTSLGTNTPPLKEMFEKETLFPFVIARDDDFERLKFFFEQLIICIGMNEHLYQRGLIQNATGNIMLELWNITSGDSFDSSQEIEPMSLHEELTLDFVKLLHQNYKEKRDVTFYATELCVTPVNLTRIVKQITGRTVMTWISFAVLEEAKALLHQANVPVQAISEELNFSDQAAFSKFFKKHMGMSPVDYRRGLGGR